MSGPTVLAFQFRSREGCANPYGSATAVSSGWGDTDFPSNYFGVADELATGSGAPPTWTTSSGHATGSALAFNLGSSTGGGYTLAVGPTAVSGGGGGTITQSIYYVPNIKGGANTVTVTFNQSAASPDVRILEYSGLSTSSPLDVTAAASGSSTSASSGSATTTSANELIFGANTVYTSTKSAGTGFTSRIISPDGDIAEDENVSSAGSYSATATLSSSGNWVMQMATFKAATTTGTSVYFDGSYAPFGESYAGSGTADLSFTGQNQDTVGGMYDFLFREYHPVQGRWISPDPAGMAAASPMNPQSWNRYEYAMGNPLTLIDPFGFAPCVPGAPGYEDDCPTAPSPYGGGAGSLSGTGCDTLNGEYCIGTPTPCPNSRMASCAYVSTPPKSKAKTPEEIRKEHGCVDKALFAAAVAFGGTFIPNLPPQAEATDANGYILDTARQGAELLKNPGVRAVVLTDTVNVARGLAPAAADLLDLVPGLDVIIAAAQVGYGALRGGSGVQGDL